MALKPCKECGHEISTQAKSCPHCGADPKPPQMGLLSSLFVIILVLFIVGSISTLFKGSNSSSNKPPANFTETLKKIEAKKEQEFKQNRDAILSEGQQLITKKNYNKALNSLEKYKHINDKELQGLIKEAKERKLVDQIKGVPSHHLKENRDLYQRLAHLNPNNKKYKEKIKYYQVKIDWFGKSPVKSARDGSYRPVKNYLGIVMHDPDSLDIVGCTDVFYNKNGWLVGCIYRGNNAFGAKIKNSHWFLIRQNTVVKQFDSDAFIWK